MAVAVVERFKEDSTYGLPAGTKNIAVVERWPLVEVPVTQTRDGKLNWSTIGRHTLC